MDLPFGDANHSEYNGINQLKTTCHRLSTMPVDNLFISLSFSTILEFEKKFLTWNLTATEQGIKSKRLDILEVWICIFIRGMYPHSTFEYHYLHNLHKCYMDLTRWSGITII